MPCSHFWTLFTKRTDRGKVVKHQPEGHPEEELIEGLEPDQLLAAASKPLPRLRLTRSAEIGLRVLRGFVLLIAVLVIYAFVLKLRAGQ